MSSSTDSKATTLPDIVSLDVDGDDLDKVDRSQLDLTPEESQKLMQTLRNERRLWGTASSTLTTTTDSDDSDDDNDAEFARKLQAQFDREQASSFTLSANNDKKTTTIALDDLSSSSSSSDDDDSSASLQTVTAGRRPGSHVPRYRVDLDQPANGRNHRWHHVIEDYREKLIAASERIDREVREMGGKFGGFLISCATGMLKTYSKMGGVFYGTEIRAISKQTGIPLGQLVLLQIVYECFATCTSCVVEIDGTPIHLRTMDWEMELLLELTAEIEFYSNNQKLFTATTWVGCVGVFTGIKEQAFSISINFRSTGGSFFSNLKKGLGRGWPVSFLVRELLESETSYSRVVTFLANSKIMAPCYLTVCGVRKGEGVVITRGREREYQRWTLAEHGACIQCNMDHWSTDPNDDIMWSVRRRAVVRSYLDSFQSPTIEDLWLMMCLHPVQNELTVYTSIMCARTGHLETVVSPHQSILGGPLEHKNAEWVPQHLKDLWAASNSSSSNVASSST
eukprot:CAMPEP_0201553204 /NCGR_PEP_ID=MMETSP0173_2-20130828/19503_1 /ASSEMBLY_ACC=CAM_ASM_000268 /TAXON_ID=218659 /ORGANISM="Vexillifera sp., Strain DIVA3 564/2" /LENGTH=508 /DNA_ID=CAMNT_0047963831 /DNA_START=44 /DNA_END=1566 /DNA_ORIENTATION=+